MYSPMVRSDSTESMVSWPDGRARPRQPRRRVNKSGAPATVGCSPSHKRPRWAVGSLLGSCFFSQPHHSSSPPHLIEDEGSASCPTTLESSYEKPSPEHRRGSAPNTPNLSPRPPVSALTPPPPPMEGHTAPSRFANFFSKRSFKNNPLKRTKSVTKLERKHRAEDTDGGSGSRLRTSRSHESLLQSSPSSLLGSVDLSGGGVQASGLHPSLLGPCFQLSSQDYSAPRYYLCRSLQDRDAWVHNLNLTIHPDKENMRRTEKSLNIWILEAKGMASKKKYFCEVCLDKTLYARTSSKQKSDLCFWGEKFEFNNLSQVDLITVNLYREADKKKRRDKNILLGNIEIPISSIHSNQLTEKWYRLDVEKGGGNKNPISIRIKSRFQAVDILPLSVYTDFIQYLKENYLNLSELLEPVINVRTKEDIATALVHIMQREGMAGKFLADMILADVNKNDDQSLTFRGNTLATKAMEAYMKLLGDKYLQDTLVDLIARVLESNEDCEVDPMKVSNSNTLQRNQANLMSFVEMAWLKIIKSASSFPLELKAAFNECRQRLTAMGKEDLANNIISASIFLRFLCPAILSPSLFNLTQEYPQGVAARNLTLIAKTLQTLANFTRFGGKECFMEFMNEFVEREWGTMKSFLRQISSHPTKELGHHHRPSASQLEFDGYIDIGKELSILHGLLVDCLPRISAKQKDYEHLQTIVDGLSAAMSQPTLVRQISTPTPPSSLHRYPHPHPLMSSHSLGGGPVPPSPIPGINGHSSRPSTLPRSACLTLDGTGGEKVHLPSDNGTLHSNHRHYLGSQRSAQSHSSCIYGQLSSHSVDNISGYASGNGRHYTRGAVTPDYIRAAPAHRNNKEMVVSPGDSSPDSQVSTPTWDGGLILPPPLAFNNPMYHFPPSPTEEDHSPCSSLSSHSSEEISIIDSGHHSLYKRNPSLKSNKSSSGGGSHHHSQSINPCYSLSHGSFTKLHYHHHQRNHHNEAPRSSDTSPTTPTNAPPCEPPPPPSNTPGGGIRSLEEYEYQVEELRRLLLELQSKLQDAEMRLSRQQSDTDKVVADWRSRLEAGEERIRRQQEEKDQQMKNIITRLITVEEELRREQQEMQGVISAKQKVIDAQERKIQSLDAANTHLLSVLSQLKERYSSHNGVKVPTLSSASTAATSSQQLIDSDPFKTSSC